MKEQANPAGRMLSYYGYATDRLKPKVTDKEDKNLLDLTVNMIESILWNWTDIVGEQLLDEEDRVKLTEDIDPIKKIEEFRLEQTRLLSKAERLSKDSIRDAEIYRNLAKQYGEMITHYEEAKKKGITKIVQQRSSGKTLVRKLGNVGEEVVVLKNKFENHLREFGVEISAEDRARYVADPDHMVYDTILKLREKYDPTGRI